jgi:hypothetical protein
MHLAEFQPYSGLSTTPRHVEAPRSVFFFFSGSIPSGTDNDQPDWARYGIRHGHVVLVDNGPRFRHEEIGESIRPMTLRRKWTGAFGLLAVARCVVVLGVLWLLSVAAGA